MIRKVIYQIALLISGIAATLHGMPEGGLSCFVGAMIIGASD